MSINCNCFALYPIQTQRRKAYLKLPVITNYTIVFQHVVHISQAVSTYP